MKKYVPVILFLLLIGSVSANVLEFLRYSSTRPLITVNGIPITRKMFQDRVDYLYSKPILTQMIWQQIVEQAATANNCTASDADVQNAIDELQRSTPSVVETARKSDPNLMVFKSTLRSNLELRNLRMLGIQVSPQQVQDFYNTHLQLFKLPQQTQTTLVITTDAEDANSAQRLLQNGVAPSIIAQQPNLGVVGVNVKLNQQLPAYVGQEVLAMKSGDVKIIPVGTSFAVVKASSVANSGVPPLSQIADQVKIAATLALAPSEADELKKLRNEANITVQIDKYTDAVPDENSTP
jgi:hypothetical protein